MTGKNFYYYSLFGHHNVKHVCGNLQYINLDIRNIFNELRQKRGCIQNEIYRILKIFWQGK